MHFLIFENLTKVIYIRRRDLMDENMKKVKDLYSDGQAIADMFEYSTKKLKKWEIEVVSDFPLHSSILDIGCGMGREAFCLYDKGFKVTGIDISEKVIDIAKNIAKTNNAKIDFLVSNGLDLPFANSTFDIIIIWAQTFGLFYGEKNQQYIIGECKRVLKNNGILSFSCHSRDFEQEKYPQFLKDNKFYPYADTDCYWETFTLDEINACAKKAGFKEIESKQGFVYTEDDGIILHCKCRK